MLAAISSLSAGLVGGPVVWSRVCGVFPTAVYLLAGSPGREQVLPVVTSDALLLPTAVRLPATSAEVSWGVAIGDLVAVGRGRVELPALGGVSVVRAWRPSRVTVRPADLRYAGWSPVAARDLVGSRIGRGSGLTPEGDDELCGVLLVAHALGGGVNPLRDHVLGALHRTTSLSAGLLRAAGAGYAVPELAAYVEAVLPGRAVPAVGPSPRSAGQSPPHVAPLRAAVAAIGHSSGSALLRGVQVGLDHYATSTREPACA